MPSLNQWWPRTCSSPPPHFPNLRADHCNTRAELRERGELPIKPEKPELLDPKRSWGGLAHYLEVCVNFIGVLYGLSYGRAFHRQPPDVTKGRFIGIGPDKGLGAYSAVTGISLIFHAGPLSNVVEVSFDSNFQVVDFEIPFVVTKVAPTVEVIWTSPLGF